MSKEYIIGVMLTPIENPGPEFEHIVSTAIKITERIFAERIPNLKLAFFKFIGPHLTPTNGGYAPMEFLQMGLIEKIEREPNFLLVVTEVELAPRLATYSVALPSALTNVGIVSTKRLDPRFWGKEDENDVTAQRLAGLLLYTTGHLLNLDVHPKPDNIMYRYDDLSDLEVMRTITDQQIMQITQALPLEARDLMAETPAPFFVFRRVLANWSSIWRTVRRANPFRLAFQLTTMITAAISLMIVIFFSTEMWDIGSTVELYQFMLFAVLSITIATLVLYRSYSLHNIATRTRRISESLAVTNAATLITLLLTMLVLYILFWLMVYFGILTFFPQKLMETWPTVDPAVRTLDHIKLSTFIAAMGILAGSLGGRAENKDVIRHILFINARL